MRPPYVAPLIQLAPMEGVLDWLLREALSAIGGVDRMVTEFVRVTDRLLPDHVFERYAPELHNGGRTRHGTPVYIQLLGGQAEPVARNAERAAALGAPGIDLNFGCPAKTVNRHDGGATLLKDPRRLFEVASAVRQAVPAHVPVTAKVRLGFDHKEFHREIGAALSQAQVNHIVVHARTKMEMYTPPAHWHFIRSMREGLNVPILANGDIWSTDDYQKCVEASGVQAVALGRGLVARPLLAHEIRRHLDLESQVPEFKSAEFLDSFFQANVDHRGEAFALARLKQILRYWARAEEYKSWFERIKTASTLSQAQTFLYNLRKDEEWKLSFTPKRTAPSVFAPRTC